MRAQIKTKKIYMNICKGRKVNEIMSENRQRERERERRRESECKIE